MADLEGSNAVGYEAAAGLQDAHFRLIWRPSTAEPGKAQRKEEVAFPPKSAAKQQ